MKTIPAQKKKDKQSLLLNSYKNSGYSKKSTLESFRKNDLDNYFSGRKINLKQSSLQEYQNLFIYDFILKNISKGARILKIGSGNTEILDHFKNEYECWELKNQLNLISELSDYESIKVTKFNNEEIILKNIYNYFDFVYSVSAFDDLEEEGNNYYRIEFNLNTLLKPGAYSLHSFRISIINNSLKYNKFLNFLTDNSKLNITLSKCLTGFIQTNKIIADPDLLFEDQKPATQKKFIQFKKNKESDRIFLYNVILKKGDIRIPSSTVTKQSQYLEKNPAYLFHHIPKCGGKSTADALSNWFQIESDHFLKEFTGYNDYVKYRYNVDRLSNDFCLMGHYNHEASFVHQRYPEFVQKNDKYRLITFVREPFKHRVSRYYYLKQKGIIRDKANLESILQVSNNLISSLIPCNESNYKEVLDRYFFIGITEYLQESLDKLAKLIGKRKVFVPKINTSSKDSQVENLSGDFMKKFREDNKLDFMVYEYCLEKFHKY